MKKKILLQTLLSASLLATIAPVTAIEIDYNGITGNFDTTVSWGAAQRIQSRNPAIIANSAGGTSFSANTDDGNKNYNKGLISNVFKVTNDIDVDYKNFGAFVRSSYFYDFFNRDKKNLSPVAQDKVGSDGVLLDAYIRGSFEVAGRPLDVRLGKQVVSWGESTFIQNSINAINPINAIKIRVPGAELREALVPIPMIWASQELSDTLSVEALYMTSFEHTEIDPKGAYFSTNDFASDGGQFVTTGFGFVPDVICANPAISPATYAQRCIPRAADNDAKQSGQFGVALRWLAEDLNDTEFGFYYLNYHSRLPIISGVAVSTIGVGVTGRYFIEYPEDIQLFGVSFNTMLEKSGVAVQGELSYRKDAPVQIDDVEILFGALRIDQAPGLGGLPFQLRGFAAGDIVSGYRSLDIMQYQMTGTKLFGASNPFNADQLVLLGEAGVTHVLNMPDKSVLRFDGPGSSLPGNAIIAGALVPTGPSPIGGFADATSWGYRLVARLDYNSVGNNGVNLSPRIVFKHDVRGTSPGPGGNFIEGRKALTLGLGATYLNEWQFDASYTNYFGGGLFNLISDRDFVAISAKYSF
ncbi:MAG: DUF1302 domain-containing protein [Gammaproteobacteria bacterium]|nr:DUF1302 domain-containing protein [Gammaproteobacteria bacterium]